MRVIVPDTHGRDWFAQQLGSSHLSRNPIFLGDYVDSYDIPADEQWEQLKNIIAYKTAFPETVLLLGNHDVQYFHRWSVGCTGYQQDQYARFNSAFVDNMDKFAYAVEHDGYLITHAGVSKRWLRLMSERYGVTRDTLVEFINSAPREVFWCGKDNGGFDECSGPLWVRKVDMDDPGFPQIVGHTFVKEPVTRGNITYIDTGKLFLL